MGIQQYKCTRMLTHRRKNRRLPSAFFLENSINHILRITLTSPCPVDGIASKQSMISAIILDGWDCIIFLSSGGFGTENNTCQVLARYLI